MQKIFLNYYIKIIYTSFVRNCLYEPLLLLDSKIFAFEYQKLFHFFYSIMIEKKVSKAKYYFFYTVEKPPYSRVSAA